MFGGESFCKAKYDIFDKNNMNKFLDYDVNILKDALKENTIDEKIKVILQNNNEGQRDLFNHLNNCRISKSKDIDSILENITTDKKKRADFKEMCEELKNIDSFNTRLEEVIQFFEVNNNLLNGGMHAMGVAARSIGRRGRGSNSNNNSWVRPEPLKIPDEYYDVWRDQLEMSITHHSGKPYYSTLSPYERTIQAQNNLDNDQSVSSGLSQVRPSMGPRASAARKRQQRDSLLMDNQSSNYSIYGAVLILGSIAVIAFQTYFTGGVKLKKKISRKYKNKLSRKYKNKLSRKYKNK